LPSETINVQGINSTEAHTCNTLPTLKCIAWILGVWSTQRLAEQTCRMGKERGCNVVLSDEGCERMAGASIIEVKRKQGIAKPANKHGLCDFRIL